MDDAEKINLQNTIKQNQHELYILSFAEMENVINGLPPKARTRARAHWDFLSTPANIGAGYYSASKDAALLSKLITDLGGARTRCYIKSYGGKPHIVLKGHPGLRKILTGTRYGIKNPKVIAMGLGKAAAGKIARSGGLLTIVLLTGYRVADFFLRDEATLSELVGTLATDIVKVGITVGASLALMTMPMLTTLAIGPLLVVVAAGFFLSLGLESVDEKYGLTKRLIAGIEEVGNDLNAFYEHRRMQIVKGVAAEVDTLIDVAIDCIREMIIRSSRKALQKYVPMRPKAYLL